MQIDTTLTFAVSCVDLLKLLRKTEDKENDLTYINMKSN